MIKKIPGEEFWITLHITVDPDTGKFIAWDETEADELGRFACRDDAVKRIIQHAKEIEND